MKLVHRDCAACGGSCVVDGKLCETCDGKGGVSPEQQAYDVLEHHAATLDKDDVVVEAICLVLDNFDRHKYQHELRMNEATRLMAKEGNFVGVIFEKILREPKKPTYAFNRIEALRHSR